MVVEVFTGVQDEITHSRPVLLAYCSDCDDTAGLGHVDHLAMITGYYQQDGVPYIYIDTGWYKTDYQLREWTVPDGNAYVYPAQFDEVPTGTGWCAADDLTSYFTPYDAGLDYSCSQSTYDDFPVMRDIEGTVCDRIAWDVSATYTFSWRDSLTCLTPEEVERIQETIDEIQEEMSDTPCEEDSFGNPVCP